jgi:hypothetical protein
MGPKVGRWFLPVFVLAPLCAQEWYPRHNLTLGAGASRPRGDLGPVLEDSPGISVAYGYRFQRYFQADVGLDVLFGAARIRDFLTTDIGYFRIKDREYFLPLGGRAILPFAGGRLLVSGGGGGVWMRYNERINQPSYYFRIDCPVCSARSGWGYYALGNVSFFLNRNQNFRVGMTTKVVRGHTDGEGLGPVPGFRTRDKWLHLNGEVGFSF